MSDQPSISCVTVTGGRVKWLQEALACFLSQDYQGPHELVLLNTCEQQEIEINHTVREQQDYQIHNLKQRPRSLGHARNLAARFAKGDIIVTFDDDDLCKHNLLSTYAKAFKEGIDWVRLNPTFYAEAYQIKGQFSTWINSVAFRKSAFEKVGGYDPALSVGEDRNLFSKLTAQCQGVTVDLKPEEMPWIYNWGNGTYHASGQGDDKPGELTAWERCRTDLERRIQSGKEPVGVIKLVPKLEHDPRKMVDDWLQKQLKPQTNKPPICMVQLGRYGDIINVLPIAYHIAQEYDRPHFIVSKEFASVLDGCSYVIPDVVDLRNDQINEALAYAQKKYPFVVNTQIWGTNYHPTRHTDAYNLESWHTAGFGYQFKNPQWYPVFDNRDYMKEQDLADKLLGHCKKPVLLVNLTHSHSSPFPEGPQVLEKLRLMWADNYDIVDVSTLRFDRIYELLTAIERSRCVISIDTALIHLTSATKTPLVAFVNPKPWQGTIPRSPKGIDATYDVAKTTYSGTLPDCERSDHRLAHVPPTPPPVRNVFHVLERHLETDEKQRWRKNIAEKSWEKLYTERGVIPRHYREYKRNAKDAISDPRALPFLKDVLEFGMAEARDCDIIMWTNDDNYLHPGVFDQVQFHCSLWGVVSAQRCEFVDCAIPVGPVTPQMLVAKSRSHMGRDLFAFTKEWLMKKWDEIPDLILGASDFDLLLACMIRLQWGIVSTRLNLEQTFYPAEMPRGYVAHQYHPPRWRNEAHVNSDPSQMWNRQLFHAWAQKHLPALKFHAHLTI